ncbi:hypothetical protein CsSME_00049967 [Camellia sinensis var. sinensis]
MTLNIVLHHESEELTQKKDGEVFCFFCNGMMSYFRASSALGFWENFNLRYTFVDFHLFGIRAPGYPRLVRVLGLWKHRQFVEREHLVTTSLSRPIRVKTLLGGAATLYEDISKVDVVREFEDVFQKILGPLPRQVVEFRIDLVPGVAPISKAASRMAPKELVEMKKQMKERKGSFVQVTPRGSTCDLCLQERWHSRDYQEQVFAP